MKIRYKNEGNRLREVARVYSEEEHGISFEKIDQDAVRVIRKLLDNGFETYLVGGALRDLYLGFVPKDFDVVTKASPRQVHRIFPNSRIIGRRFKIVHVVFGKKIIEVSTFRSLDNRDYTNDNNYGSVEEDAQRRDFSINSLYYNIEDHSIVDFNNALKDFQQRKITSLIPLSYTFDEDPVRMIRALKCSVITGFKLRGNLKRTIKRKAPNLSTVSTSRLTEELGKILTSGYSCRILKILDSYNLLVYLLPCISVYAHFPQITESLQKLDDKIQQIKADNPDKNEIDGALLFFYLTSPLIIINEELKTSNEIYKDVFRQIKVLIAPNTPPNFELEKAAKLILKDNGIALPKPPAKRKTSVSEKEMNKRNYTRRVSKKSEID